MRVTQLVMEKQAYGWSPEELRYQHPHLTLGQVYSALAYYADHHEELDEAIEDELKSIDQYRSTLKQAKLGEKLRAKGLL
jgi:2'-5' RNA ligase